MAKPSTEPDRINDFKKVQEFQCRSGLAGSVIDLQVQSNGNQSTMRKTQPGRVVDESKNIVEGARRRVSALGLLVGNM